MSDNEPSEREYLEGLDAAAVDRAEDRWASERVEVIHDDPESSSWSKGTVEFTAQPLDRSGGMCTLAGDPTQEPMLLARDELIDLRDFLTTVIEGTLPPYAPPADDEEPF